jgi:hypothetical protein
MARTPEGKVKDDLRVALHEAGIYPFMVVAEKPPEGTVGCYYMPVAGPYAIHGIHDFVGCVKGRFWSIETKAPKNPDDETYHQGCFREAVNTTGGIALTGVREAKPAVARLLELLGA